MDPDARTALEQFRASLSFELDDFQVEACLAVEQGHGVLVAAPTGAGKTIVGEFAVDLALRTGRKAFYTTPIKALSNQKYHDLVARHGTDRVGLLTGDVSINGEAPVVVMTTEVLRNMIYAGSRTLDRLGFVVMDEVHYLADRFRGAVWEEVIIHLAPSVQVVSLSATVSNAEEFGDWLATVRGNTEIIVSEHRPVPLWQHMLVGHTLHDLFVGVDGVSILAPDPAESSTPAERSRLNPDLVRAIAREERESSGGRAERGRGDRARGEHARSGRPGRGASRADVVLELEHAGLLPAITFIFSRAGCEGAVAQLLRAEVRLIAQGEGDRIRRWVEERVGRLEDAELSVLGYWDFVDGLSRGFAAHHAGMLPLFREIVEELFTAGRIRCIYATETLALGINMPARTVVLEKLVKYNGEAHVEVTPAEYTQLTGRAGRRGIDVEGHAVVQWSRGLDPYAVGGLASTRTYPLRSSFRPTSNMAVNLVARVGRHTAREILETSFAQFQADRAVVGLATQVRRNEEALNGHLEAMTCHLGDFASYAALRRALVDAEKAGRREKVASRRAETATSLEALRIGDVFRIGSGRRAGWAVVVAPARSMRGAWSGPFVVTEDKHAHHVSLNDVPSPVTAVATVRVPSQFNPKNPRSRRDLATSLRIALPPGEPSVGRSRGGEGRGSVAGEDAGRDSGTRARRIEEVRRRLTAHPCHQCPDREEHARWAERWWRLTRDTEGLQRRVEGRTNSVAQTFDRICAALGELGYLTSDGESVTTEGERLRRLYTEKDLLAAECLRAGLWKRLDPPSLAACVSTLVHEPRGEPGEVSVRMPTDEVASAIAAMQRAHKELATVEEARGLTPTGAPEPGIAWSVHRWASGKRLDEVLRGSDLAAGDFVRRCKQIVDLLGQVADASADEQVRRSARRAIDAVRRGVVATD